MKEIYLEFSKVLLLTLESVFNNFHKRFDCKFSHHFERYIS